MYRFISPQVFCKEAWLSEIKEKRVRHVKVHKKREEDSDALISLFIYMRERERIMH
jgi:hypothetical protein